MSCRQVVGRCFQSHRCCTSPMTRTLWCRFLTTEQSTHKVFRPHNSSSRLDKHVLMCPCKKWSEFDLGDVWLVVVCSDQCRFDIIITTKSMISKRNRILKLAYAFFRIFARHRCNIFWCWDIIMVKNRNPPLVICVHLHCTKLSEFQEPL